MKQEVVEYLSGIPCWFLATTDIDNPAQPRVRPFSFCALDNDRICFCTATNKDVYEQLQENPLLELSGWKPGSGWIVVEGTAQLDTLVSAETRQAGYDHMTGLGETYLGPDDPRLTFFTITNAKATLADIDGGSFPIDLES